MQSLKMAEQVQHAHGAAPNLNDRYGKIGISAVAAAVRFRAETRPPAPAARQPVDIDQG